MRGDVSRVFQAGGAADFGVDLHGGPSSGGVDLRRENLPGAMPQASKLLKCGSSNSSSSSMASIAGAAREMISAMGAREERRQKVVRAQEAVEMAVEGLQAALTAKGAGSSDATGVPSAAATAGASASLLSRGATS